MGRKIGESISSSAIDIEKLLTARLERAQAAKQLNTQIKAQSLARYLITVLRGMAVMDKVHDDAQILDDVKTVILQMLQPHLIE